MHIWGRREATRGGYSQPFKPWWNVWAIIEKWTLGSVWQSFLFKITMILESSKELRILDSIGLFGLTGKSMFAFQCVKLEMVEIPSSGFTVTPCTSSDTIWRFAWWTYQVVGLRWHHVHHLIRFEGLHGGNTKYIVHVVGLQWHHVLHLFWDHVWPWKEPVAQCFEKYVVLCSWSGDCTSCVLRENRRTLSFGQTLV
jgi:hypothetical protein